VRHVREAHWLWALLDQMGARPPSVANLITLAENLQICLRSHLEDSQQPDRTCPPGQLPFALPDASARAVNEALGGDLQALSAKQNYLAVLRNETLAPTLTLH
jgi:hypothetical protein